MHGMDVKVLSSIRYMKVELRHLSFVSSELDNGSVCPACSKEPGPEPHWNSIAPQSQRSGTVDLWH